MRQVRVALPICLFAVALTSCGDVRAVLPGSGDIEPRRPSRSTTAPNRSLERLRVLLRQRVLGRRPTDYPARRRQPGEGEDRLPARRLVIRGHLHRGRQGVWTGTDNRSQAV